MRVRLDVALTERGLAPSRSRARDLVRLGQVTVNGAIAAKAGLLVGGDASIAVAANANPYVSRGGLKLAAALDAFDLSPSDLTTLDVGASTGGFTQVLLERGAAKVYAVDVGRDQLHDNLRNDERVVSLESSDVRDLELDDKVGAIVIDVSFISLLKVLPAVLPIADAKAWLVALIKPQFEAGRDAIGKGGIVRDETARMAAIDRVRDWISAQPGWRILDVIPSPIDGGSGNAEYLIGATRDD